MNFIPHPSMRGHLAYNLYHQMVKNPNIWVITNDLGYKMWDPVRQEFPERFINCGAAEQLMLGMAVGLALEGKIPIVYSITSFLLFRSFETIRNYIHHESIPVKLIGAGRDKDYIDDGISHWAEEDKQILAMFSNIKAIWPETIEEIPKVVDTMIKSNKPWYVNLKR